MTTLNPDPDDQLAARLRGQITALVRRLRQEAQEGPVPFSHLVVLGTIDRLGDDATPTAISTSERLRSSNLAALLRELEAAGHIERRNDPHDRRKTRIALTRQGRRLLYGNREQREQWLESAMKACLSAQERAELARAGMLLERLVQFDSASTRTITASRKKAL